jgi:hypothetical protein
MRTGEFREGYTIFYVVSKEDNGYEKAAEALQAEVRKAEKDFDIQYLSGPSFRDDGSSSRNVYFASQGAILKRKDHGKG